MGRTAETRECECVMFTWACGGRPGETGLMERGFFGRSTMLPVVGRVGEDRGEARSLGVG